MSETAKLTPHSPIVRAATNNDVLAMAKVHIASWRETYSGMLPESMLANLSIASEAIRWQRMLDHPPVPGGTLAFVAEQHGEVVAYGSCNAQRAGQLRDLGFTGEVSQLYVLRRVQKLSLGSSLMSVMASALLERGHHAVSLWVLEQNVEARHFYEHAGGALIAERRVGLAEVAYGWNDLRTLAVRH